MLEKIVISHTEKDLIIHFLAFLPAISYCLMSNLYLLIKASEIQSSIRKNGDKMESDLLYSLSLRSNFWNEAAALCTEKKFQRVHKIRIAIYVIWIPMIILTIALSDFLISN